MPIDPNSVETGQDTTQSYPQWVEGLKELDSQAWDVLLRYYVDDLRRDIRASLGKRGLPPTLVDDIEQETWLTAVRKMSEFVWEGEDKFYHWLRAIAFNHVRTYQRHSASNVSVDDYADHDTERDLETFLDRYSLLEEGIEERIIRQEQLLALDRAMRQLKPQEREIVLRWLLGETPLQLATVYQLKARSISMRLWRAKEKIEAYLVALHMFNNEDFPDA